MGMDLTKILAAGATACVAGLGSFVPAFAGSAGAADSRDPRRPPARSGPYNGRGGNNRGNWQWQREGGWRGGDGYGHRGDGGFGWAPFVFGGLAAGALLEATTPHSYG